MGCMIAWPSPFLTRLTESDELGFQASTVEASWTVSIMSIGRVFGAVLGAVLGQYLGNRKGTLLSFVPYAVGWVIFMFAKSVIWADISRFIGGMGSGMTFSVFSLFIGEVSTAKYRGAIISVALIGSPAGSVITSALGAEMSLPEFSQTFFILDLVGFVILLWMPDSPHYLVANGDMESAKRSLRWYRAYDDVDSDLKEVVQFMESSRGESFWAKINEFRTAPHLRKGLIIVIMLFVFQQATGLNSLMSYMGVILDELAFNLFKRPLVVTFSYVVSTITSILSTFLIDKWGRKGLEIISCIGSFIALMMLGTNYLLVDYGVETEKLQYLTVVSVFAFVGFLFFGMGPVPGAVLGEVFPSNLKSIAGCLGSMSGAIAGFVSAKTYEPIVKAQGQTFVFYGHAALALIALFFVMIFLPETKGKTLTEIQDMLVGNKDSNNNSKNSLKMKGLRSPC